MMSGETHAVDPGLRPAFVTERVIGANHVRAGKPCQDAAGGVMVGDAIAVAVADGHGTSAHGEIGAEFAIEVTLAALVQFAEGLAERGATLAEVQAYAEHPLRVQLVRAWAERVRGHSGDAAAPLLPFGSTLLFALTTPSFLLLGQLGDGDMLVVTDDAGVIAPLPPDPLAFADETPSLCLPEAWRSLRVLALPAPTHETLLLLCTDGYSKSYASDAVFQQIAPDYLGLVRAEGLVGLAPHLAGFLDQVTIHGSGDDIAVALVYWAPDAATTPEKE